MPENKLTPATGAGQVTNGERTARNRNILLEEANADVSNVVDSLVKRLHEGDSLRRTLLTSRSYAVVFLLLN
jgi:hypothetical protein